jgi:hypothetical protein
MESAEESQKSSERRVLHGWLDAPWPEPTEVAKRDSTRSRRVYRQVLVVAGAVTVASTLLPWEERYKWFLGARGGHHYLSFESTFGLALPPWATLVPFLGVALICVALRMHPDSRRVGITLVAIAAACVVCCVVAIANYESAFFAGLNQAKTWGGCGLTTPCSALAPPWRDASGPGAYAAAGSAIVALVVSTIFTRSAWFLDRRARGS